MFASVEVCILRVENAILHFVSSQSQLWHVACRPSSSFLPALAGNESSFYDVFVCFPRISSSDVVFVGSCRSGHNHWLAVFNFLRPRAAFWALAHRNEKQVNVRRSFFCARNGIANEKHDFVMGSSARRDNAVTMHQQKFYQIIQVANVIHIKYLEHNQKISKI